MRRRKVEDDDMLVTHTETEPKDMSERTGSEDTTTVEEEVDLGVLAARLAAATDSEERERLIALIQERAGNQEAERIIRLSQGSEE